MLQVIPTTCPKCEKCEEFLAVQTGDGKCVCKYCGCPIIFEHKHTSQTILDLEKPVDTWMKEVNSNEK